MKQSTLIAITGSIGLSVMAAAIVFAIFLAPKPAITEEVNTESVNRLKVGDIVYVSGLNLTGVVNEIRGVSKRAEVLWNTGVMNQYSIDTTILKKVE